jgi:hypothetical protein
MHAQPGTACTMALLYTAWVTGDDHIWRTRTDFLAVLGEAAVPLAAQLLCCGVFASLSTLFLSLLVL